MLGTLCFQFWSNSVMQPRVITGLIVYAAAAVMSIPVRAADDKPPSYPSLDYEVARTHELKPHRRTIPLKGLREGLNQLSLKLVVSSMGDVLNTEASGDENVLKFWPQLQDEVYHWRFTPFESNGKAVTAEIQEYIDLVPPERLPSHHVAFSRLEE